MELIYVVSLDKWFFQDSELHAFSSYEKAYDFLWKNYVEKFDEDSDERDYARDELDDRGEISDVGKIFEVEIEG